MNTNMTCTTILAGLPEAKASWFSLDLLRYLILLAELDAIAGLYIAHVVERCEVFTLPRCGYARWYRRAMVGSERAVCLALAPVTAIACLTAKDSPKIVLLAALLLGLNLLVLTNLQLFLSLLTQNNSLGYLVCMMLQLLSLFASEGYPEAVKLCFPGNWGMLVRTNAVNTGGLPIGPILGLELGILALFWAFGWRIIRKNRRG